MIRRSSGGATSGNEDPVTNTPCMTGERPAGANA